MIVAVTTPLLNTVDTLQASTQFRVECPARASIPRAKKLQCRSKNGLESEKVPICPPRAIEMIFSTDLSGLQPSNNPIKRAYG